MATVDQDVGLKGRFEFDKNEIKQQADMLSAELSKEIKIYDLKPDKRIEGSMSSVREFTQAYSELINKVSELASMEVISPKFAEAQSKFEDAMKQWEKFSALRDQQPVGSDQWKDYDEEVQAWSGIAQNALSVMEELKSSGKDMVRGLDTPEGKAALDNLDKMNSGASLLLEDTRELQQTLAQSDYDKKVEQQAQRQERNAMATQKTLRQVEKLAVAFARLGKQGITAITGKLSSSLKGLGKNAETATKKARRMTLAFVKAMLGVRGLYALFRKLRSAVTEGVKNIAQYQEKTNEFAQASKDLKANLAFLKNSFGAAFAPLLTMVIPYLNMAAQAVGNFMNKVGALFAMLTGKSTFIAANSNIEDYTKEVNKASGAQKKLNAELYGFDTLNKQQDKSGSGIEKMFNTENVDDFLSADVKSFVDDLKELWNNKNFYEIGVRIAEAINLGMLALDEAIVNIRSKINDLVSSLTQGLNGFVDFFNFGTLGKIFADGLNTILDASNTFMREFHFLELGQGVAESITSFFNGTEWNNLGANIALKINGLFSFIEGLTSDTELLPSLGQAIHDTIYGFFDTLEPEHIQNSIMNVINNVADLISTTDWSTVFDNAFTGLMNIVDWILNLIKNIPWDKVGSALGGVLMDLILFLFNPSNIAKYLGHITSWILSLLSAIVQFLLSAWEAAFGRVIWKMEDLGFDTIAGFFKGIRETLTSLIQASREWFEKLIDAVKEVFGISSPSKEFESIGDFIIEGLKNGIINTWNKVKDGIYETFDSFTKKVKGIFGISSPSKLFAEYGRFIDLGFAQGIEGNKSAVEFAMDDMIQGVTDSATFSPSMGIPNFSNVPIPALATGGVIPPNAYGSGQTTDMNTILGKIQTLIDRLDADRDRTIEIHNHVELDGDEIYDNVVEHNNQQIQRSGSSRLIV